MVFNNEITTIDKNAAARIRIIVTMGNASKCVSLFIFSFSFSHPSPPSLTIPRDKNVFRITPNFASLVRRGEIDFDWRVYFVPRATFDDKVLQL